MARQKDNSRRTFLWPIYQSRFTDGQRLTGEASKSMKSKLDTETTPAQKFRQFQDGLRHVLTVSKTDLQEREKQYQAQREGQKKRGPKPSSDRVSSDGD